MLGFKNINRHSVGIALAITGVPLGMYLNQFYPVTRWNPVIFFVNFILITNWKNAFQFRFPSNNKIFNWIVVFQILMLLYGLFSETGTMTTQYLSFHLYVLALCFALMSLSFKDISDKILDYIYLISLPCIVLGIIACQLYWVSGEEAWRLRNYTETFAMEPFTVANGAMVNIFSACFIFRKNIAFKIIGLISIIAGFYILFECGKRTPVIVTLIGLLYFLYCKKILSLNIFSRNAKNFIMLAVLSVVAYITIPYVTNKVDSMFENVVSGIANILGDTSVSDSTGSAIARYEFRQKAYNYINTYFSPMDYIIGGGYFIMWLDNPLLEAYLDMGILGVFMYFMIVLYYPFMIIKRRINNDLIIFSGCMALYAILSVINSGNPYMAIKYIPVCLLAFSFKLYNRKNEKIKN